MPEQRMAHHGSAVAAGVRLGEAYEAGLTTAQRRQGSHFTPSDVADMLVRTALDTWRVSQGSQSLPSVCDPACGGGVFLVTAAERLRQLGADPAEIVNRQVVGVDRDPGAVDTARAALVAWGRGVGATAELRPRVWCGDALQEEFDGVDGARGAYDIVVGNPPFQNQLAAATSRSSADRERLGRRFGLTHLRFADTASLFALLGRELLVDGGVMVMIQPRSFLVARDGERVRRRLLERSELTAVWMPADRVFAAEVDVCAPVVRARASCASHPADRDPGDVRVFGGVDGAVEYGNVSVGELGGATWSAVWAQSRGVPEVGWDLPAEAPVMGEVADATAGFRDQYYGFLDHLTDERPTHGRAARLITTAMIDPGREAWASQPVTIARRRRIAPWLDLASLESADQRLGAWCRRLSVPKVLVATQTRVIEAVVDPTGDTVPMTPVIAVYPRAEQTNAPGALVDVELLAAALSAPVAAAWALRNFGGGAMSGGSMKLAARQVLELPLPLDRAAWEHGSSLLAQMYTGHGPEDGVSDNLAPRWVEFGRVMNSAWGVLDASLLEWWVDRLPKGTMVLAR